MKTETVKTVLYIVLALITIVGAVATFLWYFAPAKTVELLHERIDLGITDDRIFQQRQDIDRMRALAEFERREKPPTKPEQQMIDIQQQRPEELKKERQQKIERYKK